MVNDFQFRNYHFNDAQLTFFVQSVCDSMNRDIDEFIEFGIFLSDVNNLQNLCDAFEVFPTDALINEEYLTATERKYVLIDAMKALFVDTITSLETLIIPHKVVKIFL